MSAMELEKTILKDTTRAYWRMLAGALVTDSGPNGYNLTNTNSVAEGVGKFSGGADTGIGNTNKKLSIASDLGIAGNGNMSVSFWVKMNAEIASGVQIFFNHRSTTGASRYFQIYYNYNGGSRVLQIDNSGNGVNYAINLGTGWHHIVIIRTGTTASEMYVDNIRIAGVAQSTSTVVTPLTTLFDDGSGSFYASCIISDMAVSNTLFSVNRVKELFEGRYVGEGQPEAGLTHGYHFNGNSTDYSGNNYHGVDTAITYSQANGKISEGAGFNGSTSKIVVQYTNSTTITYEAWFKTSVTGAQSIISFMKTWIRFNPGAGTLSYAPDWDSTSVSVNIPISLNEWHHVVLTQTGTTYALYFDGNLVLSGTTVAVNNANGTYNSWGTYNGSNVLTGALDECRIFNVGVTSRWAKHRYALGKGKFY